MIVVSKSNFKNTNPLAAAFYNCVSHFFSWHFTSPHDLRGFSLFKMNPSPMCGEAGLQTTAPANLAARAEADGIILAARFHVNIQSLDFVQNKRFRTLSGK